MCTPHHPGACLGEEAGQAEIGDHDHHPEQQGERIEVNRLCGCAETLGPKTDAASYVSPSVCLRPLGLRAGTAAAGPELFRRDHRERGGRPAQFTGQTGSTLAGDNTRLSPGQKRVSIGHVAPKIEVRWRRGKQFRSRNREIAFHGGNRGSNPLGDANYLYNR